MELMIQYTNLDSAILVTNFGIIMMTVAYDVTRFTLIDVIAGTWIQIVGWLFMVAGFILVLYSRLYLVIIDSRLRRILLPAILALVVGTNIVVYTLIYVCTGLQLGNNRLDRAYIVAWKLQLLSPIEEMILAGLYIYFFIRFLRETAALTAKESHFRKVTFYLLCIAQVVIVVCDVLVAILNYRRLIVLRTILYPFLYTLKLEFEFLVLNRLIYITQKRKEQLPAMLSIETRRPQKTDLENGPVTKTTTPLSLSSSDDTEVGSALERDVEEMERRYLGRA